jgi:hypothetical protein
VTAASLRCSTLRFTASVAALSTAPINDAIAAAAAAAVSFVKTLGVSHLCPLSLPLILLSAAQFGSRNSAAMPAQPVRWLLLVVLVLAIFASAVHAASPYDGSPVTYDPQVSHTNACS